MLTSRSLPVASLSDKRDTPLSNWGDCWARWGLAGDPVLVATLSCPRLVARPVLIKINFEGGAKMRIHQLGMAAEAMDHSCRLFTS
jgi:hypothetical protein